MNTQTNALLFVSVSYLFVRPNRCLCLPQVKELQSKLTGLVREKTDALSLKVQIEEQYNILTAQLKAKVKKDRISFFFI